MNEPDPDLRSELRVSPKPVIAIQAVLGLALVIVSGGLTPSSERFSIFSLTLYAAAVVAWLLDNWKSWAGRWFTIVASLGMIYLGYNSPLQSACSIVQCIICALTLIGNLATAPPTNVLCQFTRHRSEFR